MARNKEGGEWLTPKEAAEMLGKTNPEPIRAALRAGTFPIGCAYRADGKWIYAIPKKALEHFCRTGRVPDTEESATQVTMTQSDAAQVLRAAADIYTRMADRLEQRQDLHRKEVLCHA